MDLGSISSASSLQALAKLLSDAPDDDDDDDDQGVSLSQEVVLLPPVAPQPIRVSYGDANPFFPSLSKKRIKTLEGFGATETDRRYF